MGADLYIENLPRELQYTGWQTKVEVGYYRDAYNNSNLLWQFGLSYWTDVQKKYCKEGKMSVLNAQKLLNDLKKLEPVFKKNLKDLLAQKNVVWDYEHTTKLLKPDESLSSKDRKDWVKQYKEDYKTLRAFLKKAIELKSGIECSL